MPKKNQTTSPSNEEEKPVKPATIKIIGKFSSMTPDLRQYKPSTPLVVFDPSLQIAVEVPATIDLVLNGSQIMSAQLTNQKEPEPLFTPLGMRYIIDQFEAVMKNGQANEPEEKAKASDDDDWGDDEKEETKKADKSSDDEWEDESKDSSDDEKADFDNDEEWEN